MNAIGTDRTQDRITLRSRLSDIAQIPAWIETLVSRHTIPDELQFAINLCLEEAVSNIVIHGYGGDANRSVIVRFKTPGQGRFVFVVEDEAPPFDPVIQPELPPLSPQEEIRVGGQGIRLMRRFASNLAYERTPAGNQLTMSFSAADSANRAE